MNDKEGYVTIPLEEYEKLKASALWEECLEEFGIDYWISYDDAQHLFRERLGNQE